MQYSLLCYPEGGIVDDLTLYRLDDDRYMLTVNASNIDKDWALGDASTSPAPTWKQHERGDGAPRRAGAEGGELVQRLADTDVVSIRYYHFAPRQGGGGAGGDLAHRLYR